MHPSQRVLAPGEVVQGHVGAAIDALEGIKDEERAIHRLLVEALRSRVRMEVLRLHVESARRRLQLRFVDRVSKLTALRVEIAIPHLRLPLARPFAGEVAAQRALILLQDARHKARALLQRLVFKVLLAASEVDDLFHRQCLEVHNRHRRVNERPCRAFARLPIIRLRDHISPFAHANKLRVVSPLHLRRRSVHQALHDLIPRQSRVPASRHKSQRRCVG